MKTIIAPVNFSSQSYNTSLYAAKIAECVGTELVLLHITELPLTVAEFPLSKEVFDSLNMEDNLQHLVHRLRQETNNQVSINSKNIINSIEFGLTSFCHQMKPFAVIMNTHNYSTLEGALSENAAVYSIRHLKCPVIIIPQDYKYVPIRKIALASDLRDIYNVPVEEIKKVADYFHAKLEIFFVGKNESVINKNALSSLMLNRRMLNPDAEFSFIENEDITEGAIKLAKEHAVDMFIIIPKKHGPFHKSASKEFIRNSSIPVMAIHETDDSLN